MHEPSRFFSVSRIFRQAVGSQDRTDLTPPGKYTQSRLHNRTTITKAKAGVVAARLASGGNQSIDQVGIDKRMADVEPDDTIARHYSHSGGQSAERIASGRMQDGG